MFKMSSTEKNIKVHNSVVCLRGTLLFPQDFGVGVMFFFHFLVFSFYFLFSMNEIFMKCSRCLPQKKTTSRYTIVWFV